MPLARAGQPDRVHDPRPPIAPAAGNPKAGDTVHPLFDSITTDVTRQDQEVVELPLLLPRWQAVELEAVASRRGMTTGQMLRRVIGEMLASVPAAAKS